LKPKQALNDITGIMIRELIESEINGLNDLPPTDWEFDYENFLKDYLTADYFYAFVMIQDEKIIGTGNVFLKASIGWLANIIVDEKYRGKGLGFKMTTFLVEFLKSKGCETQLLIATELGEPVYQKVGFRKFTDYQSFETETDYDLNSTNSIRGLEHSDLKNIYELDREANGENRTHFIDKYYETGLGYFNDENELLGVYLPDFGRGLVLARDEQAGIELLKLKHSKKGKRTLLPIDNLAGIDFFEKMGLKKGDKCSRMILGKENKWKPEYIYSYGSGYCG
jgi:GNAT superfamily N-acetyltransferase